MKRFRRKGKIASQRRTRKELKTRHLDFQRRTRSRPYSRVLTSSLLKWTKNNDGSPHATTCGQGIL